MSSCLGRSHAKAAKASLDGSCRCVLQRGALRRAPLERGASSYLDALPQFEAAGALPMCRANDPRCHTHVTGADVDQASAAVLAALLFPCATLGILQGGTSCSLTYRRRRRARSCPRPRGIDLRRIYWGGASTRCVELARLALKATSETARIAAIRELLDRACGRSRQAIEVSAPAGDPLQLHGSPALPT
jgi:hypothetical protein